MREGLSARFSFSQAMQWHVIQNSKLFVWVLSSSSLLSCRFFLFQEIHRWNSLQSLIIDSSPIFSRQSLPSRLQRLLLPNQRNEGKLSPFHYLFFYTQDYGCIYTREVIVWHACHESSSRLFLVFPCHSSSSNHQHDMEGLTAKEAPQDPVKTRMKPINFIGKSRRRGSVIRRVNGTRQVCVENFDDLLLHESSNIVRLLEIQGVCGDYIWSWRRRFIRLSILECYDFRNFSFRSYLNNHFKRSLGHYSSISFPWSRFPKNENVCRSQD